MIRLKGTLKTLEVLLDQAVTSRELNIVCSFGVIKFPMADLTDLDSTFEVTNGATPVTVAGPAESSVSTVGVEELSIYNDDTADVTVIVQANDGTSSFIIRKATLSPGGSLFYNNGDWKTAEGPEPGPAAFAVAIGQQAIAEGSIGESL